MPLACGFESSYNSGELNLQFTPAQEHARKRPLGQDILRKATNRRQIRRRYLGLVQGKHEHPPLSIQPCPRMVAAFGALQDRASWVWKIGLGRACPHPLPGNLVEAPN